jgi:uncharacterized protein
VDETLSANAQLIKGQIEALIKLQGLDDEINQRRRSIRALEAEIAQAHKSVEGLRGNEEERKLELDNLTKERREAERTVKERQEQISKLNSQLFEVKTNEAYNTLQNEIKLKKQETAVQEERILELMLSEDELRAVLGRLAGETKQQQSQATGVEQEQRGKIAVLDQEIQGLQEKWRAAAQEAPADLLDRYQRLRDAKGGGAMAKIENGVCAGCHLAVRSQAIIEIKKYRSLLTCDNCARILYVD